jgi:hypothetical protein
MSGWLFFGAGGSEGRELVDTLAWRAAMRKLEASILEAKMRDCAAGHIAWLESEISRQSALNLERAKSMK